MRIIANKGTDRAVDQIAEAAAPADASAVTTSVSVFGLSTLQGALPRNVALRLLLSSDTALVDGLLGGGPDRFLRNSLTGRWLATDAPPSLTGATLDINGASYVR